MNLKILEIEAKLENTKINGLEKELKDTKNILNIVKEMAINVVDRELQSKR